MTPGRLDRLVLGSGGAILLYVGAASAFMPVDFLASYGVALDDPDVGLLSELRSGGLLLAASGVVVVAGAIRRSLARSAALLAALVFLAYAAGRALSWAVDGRPATSLLAAAAVELCWGLASGLVAHRLRRRPGPSARVAAAGHLAGRT